MTAVIQQVASLANRTIKQNILKYSSQNVDFQKLRVLMSKLRSDDVNFDMNLVSDERPYQHTVGGPAPISYIEILGSPYYTVAMFILHNGTRMPLHDHPGMHGIIKVIHGKVRITSYSSFPTPGDVNIDPPDDIMGKVSGSGFFHRSANVIPTKVCLASKVIDVESEAQLLTPINGNYHEIQADEPAAILDLLSPPYNSDDDRDCHYYRDIGTSIMTTPNNAENAVHWLMNVPAPSDFWCDSHPYLGPRINDTMKEVD